MTWFNRVFGRNVKTYVRINGQWYRTYRTFGWYDILCWTCVVTFVLWVLGVGVYSVLFGC